MNVDIAEFEERCEALTFVMSSDSIVLSGLPSEGNICCTNESGLICELRRAWHLMLSPWSATVAAFSDSLLPGCRSIAAPISSESLLAVAKVCSAVLDHSCDFFAASTSMDRMLPRSLCHMLESLLTSGWA